MRKALKWTIIILVILLPIGGYLAFNRAKEQQTSETVGAAMANQTMAIPRGSIALSVEASGTVSAARLADLGFSLSGQIQKIHVTKGQFVQAGDILAEIERSQQELALVKARTAYESARIDGTPNAIRERQLDLEIAEANSKSTRIFAPFSGVITDVLVEEGENVSNSTVVTRLMDNSTFYATVSVDELDVAKISEGQRASITIDALPGKQITGTVSDIGLVAENSGGVTTIPVSVQIDDLTEGLRSGFSASVKIEVQRVDDVLKLPVDAVVRRGNEAMVTVIRNGVQTPVQVRTGITDGREVEIVSGLDPDDRVIGFNFQLYRQGINSGTNAPAGGNPFGGQAAPAVRMIR